MRKILIASLFVLLPAISQAKPIAVQVKGMVCAFCAQGIEKKFKALPEINKVMVSLESKKVELDTKEGKDMNDADINRIVTESGYEVVKIER
ncbi:MAG: heavy-metal-associated domain-containing protein [Bdellovibrionaceae bacterium]|nr:heavy-metal-associated domain-containing protein [Pseudobdellovibrionaceae bacterium]